MAAASMCGEQNDAFTQWLEARLLKLNADLDTGVFVTYICSILESYSGYDEQKESLLDIVGEIAEDNQEEVCDELIKKWDEMSSPEFKKEKKAIDETPIDEKLSKMLCNTEVSYDKKGKELTKEELARKKAILAQYSTICDDADDDVKPVPPEPEPESATVLPVVASTTTAPPTITQNTGGITRLQFNSNKDSVQKKEKETRDKMKQDNEKKKEKDKQDRESQKNKRQERKENEKKRTQKGEKRR